MFDIAYLLQTKGNLNILYNKRTRLSWATTVWNGKLCRIQHWQGFLLPHEGTSASQQEVDSQLENLLMCLRGTHKGMPDNKGYAVTVMSLLVICQLLHLQSSFVVLFHSLMFS